MKMGGFRGRRPASVAARLLFFLTLTSLSLVPVLLADELHEPGLARGLAGAAVRSTVAPPLLLVAAGGGGAEPQSGEVPLTPAADPALRDAPLAGAPDIGIFGLLVKVVLVLAFICAIIYGMFWLIAKKGRAHSGRYGLLRLVETMPLGQNRFVGIIEVAQRYFVIGIGDHGVNPIAELDAPEIAGLAKQDDAVAAPAFLDYLNDKVRQLKRRRP